MNPTDDTNQKKDFSFSFDEDTPTAPVVQNDSGLPVSSQLPPININVVNQAPEIPATPMVSTPPAVSEETNTVVDRAEAFPQPPTDVMAQQPMTAPEPVKMKKRSKVLPVVGGVLALLLVVGIGAFASNTSYFLAVFRGDIRPFAYENPCQVNDCEPTGPKTVQITGGGNTVVVPASGQNQAKQALDNGGDGDTARDAAEDESINNNDDNGTGQKPKPPTQEQKVKLAERAEAVKVKAAERSLALAKSSEAAKKVSQDAAGAAQFAAQAASQQQQAAAAAASKLVAAQAALNAIAQPTNDQAKLDAARAAVATAQTEAAGAENSAQAALADQKAADKALAAALVAATKAEKKSAAAAVVATKAVATAAAKAAAAGTTATSGGTGGSGSSGGSSTTGTTATTASTASIGTAICAGLGEQALRDCLVNSNSGTYTSGTLCPGLAGDAYIACAIAAGNTVHVCSGNQETTGDRSGEFISDCTGNNATTDTTGGCGQIDICDASGNCGVNFQVMKNGCTTTATGGGGGGGGSTPGQVCSYIKLYVQDTVNPKKWDAIAPVATGSAVVVDDNNKLVNFTKGWTAQSKQKGFAGNTEHITKKLNASAQYNFSGTTFTLAYGTDKNYGIAKVLIDDKEIDTIDMYSATAGHLTKTYNNLSTGFHSFKLVATNTKGSSSKNTYISLDSLTVEPNTGLAVNVGQKIRLAIKGNRGRWSKARFTINGATPVETKTVVNGEYVYDYTVPATGSYTIQGEILPK